jgi:hypothetical protein
MKLPRSLRFLGIVGIAAFHKALETDSAGPPGTNRRLTARDFRPHLSCELVDVRGANTRGAGARFGSSDPPRRAYVRSERCLRGFESTGSLALLLLSSRLSTGGGACTLFDVAARSGRGDSESLERSWWEWRFLAFDDTREILVYSLAL